MENIAKKDNIILLSVFGYVIIFWLCCPFLFMLSISEPCYNNVVWTHARRQIPDPIPTICVLRVSAALEKTRKLQKGTVIAP